MYVGCCLIRKHGYSQSVELRRRVGASVGERDQRFSPRYSTLDTCTFHAIVTLDQWLETTISHYMKLKLCLLSILFVSFTGFSLRAADTFKVDPVHSSVGFAISHMAISTVKGKFDEFSGEVTLEGSEVKGAQGTIQT